MKSAWRCQNVLVESQNGIGVLRISLAKHLCWIWPLWDHMAEIWPKSTATSLLVEDSHVKNCYDNVIVEANIYGRDTGGPTLLPSYCIHLLPGVALSMYQNIGDVKEILWANPYF